MSELPPPIRLPGEPDPPRVPRTSRGPHHQGVADIADVYGAEAAAQQLTERLARVPPAPARRAPDGRVLLSPPFERGRDRVEGVPWAPATLVIFGAHGVPSARRLGQVIELVRARHATTVAIAWRHYPDPLAHADAGLFALAAEAAALTGHFWPLTRELLRLQRHGSRDFHAAMLRAGVDPDRTLAAMRAGTGTDRIADNVASALASGVIATPALFIDGERWRADLDPELVSGALQAVLPRA
jgi:2-hydroxychromene-2-carboxylate isomerase